MKSFFLVFLFFTTFACSSVTPQEKGIKVAVVNFQIVGGKTLSQHMGRIEKLAQKASAAKASYLLLPELTVFDLMPVNVEDSKTIEELKKVASLAGPYQESLSKIAKDYKLNVIGASVVIRDGESFLNRALFVDSKGKVETQDKLRPTPWEVKYNFKGEKNVKLFKAPEFSFVILICHDSEFPDISHNLVPYAPEVIFVPSMTDDQFGLNRVKMTSSARAIEHMAYVLMTGTSALPDAPWHAYVGRNHFYHPQNKFFLNMESPVSSYEESMSFYHLDLARLRASRKDARQVYPARDMKNSIKAR